MSVHNLQVYLIPLNRLCTFVIPLNWLRICGSPSLTYKLSKLVMFCWTGSRFLAQASWLRFCIFSLSYFLFAKYAINLQVWALKCYLFYLLTRHGCRLFLVFWFILLLTEMYFQNWSQQKWKALHLNLFLCLNELLSFCHPLDCLGSTVLHPGKRADKLTVCILSLLWTLKLIVWVAILSGLSHPISDTKFSLKGPHLLLSD